MTSPTVFDDAMARATAAALPMRLSVLDIFAQDRTDHEGPWIYFEIASASGDRLGMGEVVEEETGQVWLHLMMPRLSGSRDALVLRKALSVAFRVPQIPLPIGLFYDGQAFDPPNVDETGSWFRFSLMVDYRYQDRVL